MLGHSHIERCKEVVRYLQLCVVITVKEIGTAAN